ncbi:MAG: DUF2231 domain-containing protein [Phycisphaerae bacterium]
MGRLILGFARDLRSPPTSSARCWFAVVAACSLAAPLPATALAQESATPPALNKWCPVLPDEEADPTITTVYQGRTIAFCCDRCLGKFKADPQRYISRLPSLDEDEREPASDEIGRAGTERREPDQLEHEQEARETGGRQPMPAEEPQDVPLLGRLHPFIVHFPVAGIPLALLGYLLWLFSGKQVFAAADLPPLLIATLTAVAAVITGNIAHDHMRFSGSLHEIVERHELAGTTIMILALCLSAFRLWRWNRLTGGWRWLYGGALLVASGIIAITGYLGGSLVFGPDHFSW